MLINRATLTGRVAVATVVVLCAVFGTPASAQEFHIVTASGHSWAYRDLRSGRGESNRVEIEVEPGDRIVFRQTDGEHQVIFYRNRSGTSELGTQVDVSQGFQVIGSTALEPASLSRVFNRRNLACPLKQGSATLITIELTDDFVRPIYFADASSQTNNQMFGVILRRASAAASSTPDVPQAARMSEAIHQRSVGRYLWDDGRSLQALARGAQDNIQVPTSDEATALQDASDEQLEAWPLNQWFADDAVNSLSPFDPQNDWRFATIVDLDGDDDLDVIALVSNAKAAPVWWGFLNASRRRPETFANTRDWLNQAVQPRADKFHAAVRIAEAPTPEIETTACATVIDFDRDMRPDVVFSYGDNQLHFVRQKPAFQGTLVAFDRRESIDTALQFGIESVRAIDVDTLNSDEWPDLQIYGEQRAAEFFNRPGRGFASTDGRSIDHPGFLPVRAARSRNTVNGWRSLLLEDAEGTVHEYQKTGRGSYILHSTGEVP